MLETIVSLITIVSAVFAFYKWILPYLKSHIAKRRTFERQIKISLREKSISEKDELLEQLLLNQKRDSFLDLPFSISVYDNELNDLKSKLKNLSHKDQASLASYISSSEGKICCINSMLLLLFDKKLLKMVDSIFFSGNELALIARGAVQLLDGNVTGKRKLDVWRDSEPKICFGIYVSSDEAKLIEDKIEMPINTLIGPGRLSADELPKEIIARHIVPRLLFEITRYKEKLMEHRESLFLLFNYHVGLG
jgi:hypothetical protein